MEKVSKIILILFSMIMIAGSITVNAAECNCDVHENDIICAEDGKERVIKVLSDGRFITEQVNTVESITNKTYSRAASCAHAEVVGLGTKYKITESYNKSDATYCYKYRYYENAKCARCGKTGFKIYDSTWTKVKHKYSLFGKTCNECGYTK